MKKLFYFSLAVFLNSSAFAQGEFVTRWFLPLPGSGATQISFEVATSGTVSYSWQEIAPGISSGSGTFSGTEATITGLPVGSTIDLSISPANFNRIIIANGLDKDRLINISQWGTTAWTSMAYAFGGCSQMNISATDLPNLTGATSMAEMFRACSFLNGPANIGSWNTSNVTDMAAIFTDAYTFNAPIGTWNTANVTRMQGMFNNATAFNQPIGTWNTANVTDMNGMFFGASNFNQPIGTWNTAKVTDMSFMFNSASVFNQPIGTWNTAAVTNMYFMFQDALVFNQPIGTWNTGNVTSMQAMFRGASVFNQPLGSWNTAKVTNMANMFSGVSAFNQPIGTWITADVTEMAAMFYSASSFNQPIGNWNTAKVTTMGFMFNGASSFNKAIGNWNTANVTDMSSMFVGASAFNQSLGTWTLNANVSLGNMLMLSGVDCSNYSSTLIGWSGNALTPSGRSMSPIGREYGTNAVAARTNLTTTKGWTIVGDAPSGVDCSSLPVKLISFSGTQQDNLVLLEWKTANEQDNAGFEIEKSTDAKTFKKIGFVDGGGDSREVRKYNFIDFNPLAINYYRLKQIDHTTDGLDGVFEYSRLISVKSGALTFGIYPNPAQNELFVKNLGSNHEVSISNTEGKLLLKREINATMPIDIKALPTGLFFVKIGAETKKLVIQR